MRYHVLWLSLCAALLYSQVRVPGPGGNSPGGGGGSFPKAQAFLMGANGTSVGPMDMTGANYVTVCFSDWMMASPAPPQTMHDSNGNTYTLFDQANNGSSSGRLDVYTSPIGLTVSNNMTWSVTATSVFASVAVIGLQGVSTGINQHAKLFGTGITSMNTGSVTTTSAETIVSCIASTTHPTSSDTAFSVTTAGFSSPVQIPFSGGLNFSVAMSYWVQATSGTVNPNFQWGGTSGDTFGETLAIK